MWRNDVAGSTPCWQFQECNSDIIFVLDESVKCSGDFAMIRKSLAIMAMLVGMVDIASGSTRVGLITYSSKVDKKFDLNAESAVRAIEETIISLDHIEGKTDTAAALEHVRTKMLTSEAGDRSHIHNVVVVLTDGHSKDKQATKVRIGCMVLVSTFTCIAPAKRHKRRNREETIESWGYPPVKTA